MIPELEKMSNLSSLGLRDLVRFGTMPVYEMTEEPKCDKRAKRSPAHQER